MDLKNIVVLALLASFALSLGCIGEETKGGAASPIDAFNASINRYIGLVRGAGDYSESITMEISNRTSIVNVSRHGSDNAVSLGSDFYTWSAVVKNNTTFLCLRFGNDMECTNDNATLAGTPASIVASLESVLFSRAQASQISTKYNSLLRHGSLNVLNFTNSSDSYAFDVNYSLKDLTGAELASLYLSPTSPEVGVSTFSERLAFRKSDGMKVVDNLDYGYAGRSYHETNGVTAFSQSSEAISEPMPVNDTMFRALFASFSQFWTKYNNITSESGLMELIIGYHMPELCARASNFSSCIDAYTAMAKDANACPLLSGGDKDQCWYFFGKLVDNKDASYCANIANGALKADCLKNETVSANLTVPGNATALNESAGVPANVTNGTMGNYTAYD
jgi:hypothetical protein